MELPISRIFFLSFVVLCFYFSSSLLFLFPSCSVLLNFTSCSLPVFSFFFPSYSLRCCLQTRPAGLLLGIQRFHGHPQPETYRAADNCLKRLSLVVRWRCAAVHREGNGANCGKVCGEFCAVGFSDRATENHQGMMQKSVSSNGNSVLLRAILNDTSTLGSFITTHDEHCRSFVFRSFTVLFLLTADFFVSLSHFFFRPLMQNDRRWLCIWSIRRCFRRWTRERFCCLLWCVSFCIPSDLRTWKRVSEKKNTDKKRGDKAE